MVNEKTRAALILLFVLNLCFAQCIWGNRTLLESANDAPSIIDHGAWYGQQARFPFNKVADPGAPTWLSEPWFALIHNEYAGGMLPLWNPYQGFGAPLAANMQSQPFYPLSIALSLHPSPRAYNFYILARLFIAGFCTFLFLRMLVRFTAALAGGIACMLAGYYIVFITMPHLSVETLVPAGLLTAEYFFRSQTYRAFLALSIVVLFVLLGGFPESAFLFAIFLALYVLVRILVSAASTLVSRLGLASRFFAAGIAGLCLAAFLLLPFLHYLPHSANAHVGSARGIAHDIPSRTVYTYLVPLLFGPVDTDPVTHGESALRNYVGVIAVFLILVALAGIRRERGNKDLLNPLTFFFSGAIAFVVLKRYGLFLNAIGSLPVFRMLDFSKYDEAILSVSAAMLCGIGVERLMRKQLSAWRIALSFFLTAVLFASAMFGSRHYTANDIPGMRTVALATPIALLSLAGLVLVFLRAKPQAVGICFASFLALELFFAYIGPCYYFFNRTSKTARNPYAGAPFVRFLQKQVSNHDRIFGAGVLLPNWASAFGIPDIRNIDGMLDSRYLPFLRNFFARWPTLMPDFSSCFRGLGEYNFTDPRERRLLQLSSVRYVASPDGFGTPNRRIEEAVDQNRGHLLPGRAAQVGLIVIGPGHEYRETLGEHPPYERLPYAVTVPSDASKFLFSYGINPKAFDLGGDGVGFKVEIRDAAGQIWPGFYDYIDPKHSRNQRKWFDAKLDVARFRGQQIQLLFSTDPGPRGDTSYDWAGWSNFHFDDELLPSPNFAAIYEGPDADVFRFDNVLPRAALFARVQLVGNDEEVLGRLADMKEDPLREIFVNSASLDPAILAALKSMKPQTSELGTAAITSDRPEFVQIDAANPEPAVLMLNDIADSDWQAEVDGRPTKWFRADYLFRGIFLTPGTHKIHFQYRPRSFQIGSCISLTTLVILVAGLAISEQRNRKKNAGRHAAALITAL